MTTVSDTAKRRPITNVDEAKAWLADCLATLGGGFHPDTPGNDYRVFRDHQEVGRTFSRAQVRGFDHNLARADEVLSEAGLDIYEVTNDLARDDRYAKASDDDPTITDEVLNALHAYHAERGGPDASEALLEAVDSWLGGGPDSREPLDLIGRTFWRMSGDVARLSHEWGDDWNELFQAAQDADPELKSSVKLACPMSFDEWYMEFANIAERLRQRTK